MKYVVPRAGLFVASVVILILAVARVRNAPTANRVSTAKSESIAAAISDSKDKTLIEPFRAVAGHDGQILVTVPEGKFLVIELVTGRAFTAGSNSVPFQLISNAPNSGLYYIAPSHAEPFVTGTIAFYTHTAKFYVLPGEELKVFFPGGAGSDFIVTVSGYYVDAR